MLSSIMVIFFFRCYKNVFGNFAPVIMLTKFNKWQVFQAKSFKQIITILGCITQAHIKYAQVI